MKTIILFISLIFLCVESISQTLFSEDFNSMTVGNTTSGQNGWSNQEPAGGGACTGGGCVNSKISNTSLSYPNYNTTTNSHTLTPNTDAPGVMFTNPSLGSTRGTYYASFLLRISSITGTPSDFLRLCSAGRFNTIFRVFAENSGAGFKIKVGKNSGTYVSGGPDLAFNTTHLIVIKYEQNDATLTDDAISVFINPDMSSSEPAASFSFSSTGNDYNSILDFDRMMIRQNFSSGIPAGFIGAIKITLTWNNLISLGISDIESVNNLKLSPNPSDNFITVQNIENLTENFKYTIFDLIGRNVKTGNSKYDEQINIVNLSNGNYIIQIETENGEIFTEKLIKS